MPRKRHKPEEIVAKLRQVDVLVSQGQSVAEAIRQIGVTEVTYYRWRQEFGGLKSNQVKRLKELEAENTRLLRAISDLTLDKLILAEAPGKTSKPRVSPRLCGLSCKDHWRARARCIFRQQRVHDALRRRPCRIDRYVSFEEQPTTFANRGTPGNCPAQQFRQLVGDTSGFKGAERIGEFHEFLVFGRKVNHRHTGCERLVNRRARPRD